MKNSINDDVGVRFIILLSLFMSLYVFLSLSRADRSRGRRKLLRGGCVKPLKRFCK